MKNLSGFELPAGGRRVFNFHSRRRTRDNTIPAQLLIERAKMLFVELFFSSFHFTLSIIALKTARRLNKGAKFVFFFVESKENE